MDLLCYCNVSSNDERPGHISEISRIRACKHKNLVIHINTRTWGQVSRYECLYCSLDRLGRHRSFYAVSCTTRLSMLVVYVAEKILNPWIFENLFELIITNSDVFVLIDLCIYMKRRTTYDLRQAWKKARAKAYSGIFSCTLNISCSQLCNFIVKRQVIVRWNFISFSNDYLSQFLIKEKYKIVSVTNYVELQCSLNNIYISLFFKNANIWEILHIFRVLV